MIGPSGNGVQIVQRHWDGLALGRELLEQLEGFQRVVDIKIRGRFVKEEHLGFRCEATRNQGPLAFTPGKLVDQPVSEVCHVGPIKRRIDRRGVPWAGGLEAANVWVAS